MGRYKILLIKRINNNLKGSNKTINKKNLTNSNNNNNNNISKNNNLQQKPHPINLALPFTK